MDFCKCLKDITRFFFWTGGKYEPIPDECDSAGATPIVKSLPAEFLKLYQMGPIVGIGTTSKVYHIQEKYQLNGKFHLAVKIIDKRKLTIGMNSSDTKNLFSQLGREVEVLRHLNHPNIVGFRDFMETKVNMLIITEYLCGIELFDYIIDYGPMAEDDSTKKMFSELFSAVSYMHERGVIHRDIKSENIILCKNPDNKFSLKLIDFGFSIVLNHTLAGSFLGTGGYVAPEIRQHKFYSMSVDNWALGVVLYSTLSATMPFSLSIDHLPRDKKQWNSEMFLLRFPATKWDKISDSCKNLIKKLLEVDSFTRLTAKEALQQNWFKSRRNLSDGCDISNDSHDSHGDMQRRGLKPLHLPLRHTQSTSWLECKSGDLDFTGIGLGMSTASSGGDLLSLGDMRCAPSFDEDTDM